MSLIVAFVCLAIERMFVYKLYTSLSTLFSTGK